MYERTGVLVRKKFREYLLPTLMTSMAISLASVVDSMIVGLLLGYKALAALGLASPIIFCINVVYMLFGTGGITFASIERGRRHDKRANHVFTLSILCGTGVMILFLAIMLVIMEPVSIALAAGDEYLASITADSLRPLMFAGPTLMFSFGIALFIRTDGRPKSTAVIVILSNSVNLLLDFLLIGFLDTGIAGAGISTAAGYTVGILTLIPYFRSKNRFFRFTKPSKAEIKVIWDIILIGFPKALTQLTSFFRSMLLNAIVVFSLGSIGMSVMTVCTNALLISNIFVNGTSDSLLPIVGTLFGEKDYYGIRKTVKSACKVLAFACVGLMAFFMITPATVGRFFGLSGLQELAVLEPAIRLFALYLPFSAINTVLENFYATTNREKLASLIAILDGLVFVCLFAFLLSLADPNLIWLCYSLSGLATVLVLLAAAAVIRRRENVAGLLMINEKTAPGAILDVTIEASPNHAAGISCRIIKFCTENDVDQLTANRLGVAAEEMAANTAALAHKITKPGSIDIMLRITEKELILRFRDNGEIFDPTSCEPGGSPDPELTTDGIQVMKKLASNLDYSRQLGFNTTILTFSRNHFRKNPRNLY